MNGLIVPRRGWRDLFPHPVLSLMTLAIGALAVAQTVHTTFVVPYGIPSPKHPAWNIAMLCALAAAALWNVARPRYGGYAVTLVAAVMTMTVVPVPLGVFALVLITLMSLTFLDPISGCATGVTFSALMIAYGRLVPLGIMGRGSAFTFDGLVAVAVVIGACAHAVARYAAMRRREAAIRRNLHIARELHDHTTNDLSDIVMLINRHLAETDDVRHESGMTDDTTDEHGIHRDDSADSPSPVTTDDLAAIRDLALDALHHTRHTIAALDGRTVPGAPATTPVNAPAKVLTTKDDTAGNAGTGMEADAGTPIPEAATAAGERPSVVIGKNRERLRRLGYDGEVITLGDVDGPTDAARALIADFLRELFGNIARHADPSRGYTMLVSVADDACVIDLSDFVRTDDADERPGGSGGQVDVAARREWGSRSDGLHSGLARYRALIERRHGVLEVATAGGAEAGSGSSADKDTDRGGGSTGSAWTLHAAIPL